MFVGTHMQKTHEGAKQVRTGRSLGGAKCFYSQFLLLAINASFTTNHGGENPNNSHLCFLLFLSCKHAVGVPLLTVPSILLF